MYTTVINIIIITLMNYIIPCSFIKSSSNVIEHWLYVRWLISCAWFSFFCVEKKPRNNYKKKKITAK